MTWGLFAFLMLCAGILMLALDKAIEWSIKWRPRRKALKQIKIGSRWAMRDSVWVVGDICHYVSTVAMHLEDGPTHYMMFSPDYVVSKMWPLPEVVGRQD